MSTKYYFRALSSEIIKAPAALPGIRRDSRGKPGPGGKSPAAGGRTIFQATPRQIS